VVGNLNEDEQSRPYRTATSTVRNLAADAAGEAARPLKLLAVALGAMKAGLNDTPGTSGSGSQQGARNPL
jgi:hypothetical protein